MKKQHLLIALALYIVSAASSYTALSYFAPGSIGQVTNPGQTAVGDEPTQLGLLLDIDPAEPKDQECPLSGAYYTKTEEQSWSQRRPLFVMIENSPDARPQSGLSRADVVFEIVAEGGVTRFGALYYCGAQIADVTIAPVRSARSYFVDYASGFNLPMYVHVGGANVPGPTNALGQIDDYGWALQNDINQFSVGYPTFVRNANRLEGRQVATEHTMESSTEKLWMVAEERGWTNTPPASFVGKLEEPEDWQVGYQGWEFEEEVGEIGIVQQISYDFWSGYNDYSVSWQYSPELDAYLRSQGDEKHLDLNNQEQVAAANVIVLKTTEKGPINEVKHMIYGTIGTGDAYIFKHGQVIEANWSKKSRSAELEFTDGRGNDVELARGLTWISVVNLSTDPEY